MKKLIFLLALLIPSLLFAGPLQDKHKSVIARLNIAGGGSCEETTIVTQDTNDGDEYVADDRSLGQSFTTDGSARTLTKIQLYIDSNPLTGEESSTLSMRVGVGADLSSVYLGADSLLISAGTTGWITIEFGTPVALAAATQYHFNFTWDEPWADRLTLGTCASCYGGGNSYNVGSVTFNVFFSSTEDLVMKVTMCD